MAIIEPGCQNGKFTLGELTITSTTVVAATTTTTIITIMTVMLRETNNLNLGDIDERNPNFDNSSQCSEVSGYLFLVV